MHGCKISFSHAEKFCLFRAAHGWGSNPVGITCSKLTIETLEQGLKEICSKLTIKTPERRQWRCSSVFIVNFEHISHLDLMFLLLTLNRVKSVFKSCRSFVFGICTCTKLKKFFRIQDVCSATFPTDESI